METYVSKTKTSNLKISLASGKQNKSTSLLCLFGAIFTSKNVGYQVKTAKVTNPDFSPHF